LIATLSPFIAVTASGSLVEYQDVDRTVSAFMNCDGGTFQDTDSVSWFSTIEEGNELGVVRAHQQSDLATSSLFFEGDTQAAGMPLMGQAYSNSSLNTTMTLSSDSILDLSWSYLLELNGGSSGGAGMRISTEDGYSLFDIELQFEGDLTATSEMEMVAGSYLVEIYLGSTVDSWSIGEASTAFEVSMAFSSVPSPGALALLVVAILAGGTRRRGLPQP
jgi:hypothetical protein